jgi:hypothetical protein
MAKVVAGAERFKRWPFDVSVIKVAGQGARQPIRRNHAAIGEANVLIATNRFEKASCSARESALDKGRVTLALSLDESWARSDEPGKTIKPDI